MSFSTEDKKKVFDFFVGVLKKFNEPVYYEHLRGHVAQTEPVIRKYIQKECKGEKLLDYFQKRKNYFYVEKDKITLLKNKKKCSNAIISKVDKLITKQNTTSSDAVLYEVTSSNYFDSSRSDSSISKYGSASSSVDNVFVDANMNERIEYEKALVEYFSDYLNSEKKLSLNTLEMKCLPENIQYYVAKYLNSDIVLFFENNPEIFHIDDKNSVSLIDSSVLVKTSEKLPNDFAFEIRGVAPLEDNDIGSLHDFIDCAEFFFSVLKKKRFPLNYVSGHLSHAPFGVSKYLKLNYATFKDFLVEADKLFIFYDDEVAVTKNGPRLLKNAKTLLDAKWNSNISAQFLKHSICSQLKSGISANQILLSNINQADSCSNVKDISITENLNEDRLYSDKDELIVEELNISGNENISIESKNCNISDNPNSTKNKKCKIEKLNIFDDKNIDIGNVDCNKELENKLKKESLYNKTIINEKNYFEFEDQDIVDSALDVAETFQIPVNSGIFEYRNFIECVFIVQLLCLEVVEKEHILCLKYEYEAVKFFVETLEKLPGRTGDITSLKGCLGQASKDVISFMKNFYKGDKIRQFFEKYNEFCLDSQGFILKLSSDYKNHLEDKRELHKSFIDKKEVYNVYNLYNLHLHNTFIDVLECLAKICSFLLNKSRIKLSRLSGVFSKLSLSQQNFINSFNGSQIYEKLKRFLCYFSFFYVSEDCIEFVFKLDEKLLINLLSEFTEKIKVLSEFDESKLPYSDHLLDYLMCENECTVLDLDELKNCVIEGVQEILSYGSLDYSYLPNIVGYEVLHNTVLKKKDSQFFIRLLEESNLFLVKDGKISYRQDNDETVAFIQDSNSSDEICCKNSGSQKSEVPSVNEIHHEDSGITLPKKSPFIENDLGADLKEIKTFNEKLVNEDAEVDSFYKNEFTDELQNTQNDLNNERKSVNMLVWNTFDQDDAKENNESNIQDASNPSDILSHKQTFLCLEADIDISSMVNVQEGDICVSGSYSISDESKEIDKNFINESIEKKLVENIDLANEQNSEPDVIETNFSKSSQETSKSSCLSNFSDGSFKLCENQSKISGNVTSSFDLINENNTSGINKQIITNMNDVDSNCVEKVLSPENIYEDKSVEGLSFISPCAINFIDELSQNSRHCDDRNIGSLSFISPCATNFIDEQSQNSRHYDACLVKNSNTNSFGTIKLLSDVNFESNQNDDKTVQNKILKMGNESLTKRTFRKSSVPKKDSTESDSEGDRSQFNFDSNALQPLQAKIIILTLDSCIAETDISGQKKCIFCLKSCFHCDLHTYCCDCFNSLVVGDEILCYMPPTEDLNCGNMCFAFMFHKDLEARNESNGSLDTDSCQRSDPNQIISEKHSCSENSVTICNKDYTDHEYLQSSSDECQTVEVNSAMDEKRYQVESTSTFWNAQIQSSVVTQSTQIQSSTMSQGTQVQSSTASESAQVQPSVASQNTQTIESSVKKYGIEKYCQVKCTSVSQIIQTVIVTSEVECQTVVIGEIKSCFPVCEKACLTEFPTSSQNTQTFFESFDQGSQTNISGNINPQYDSSSCECQTILTGQVRECESFSDQSSQTLFNKQTDKTTQTEAKRDDESMSRNETNLESVPLTFANTACDANTGARSKYSFSVVQKAFCDTASQTLSTGPIMMKKLYQLE